MIEKFVDDIWRPAFDLLVNFPQIEPDDTETDHEHAADEEDENDDRAEADEGPAGKFVVKRQCGERNAEHQYHGSQNRDQLKWNRTERDDGVGPEPEQPQSAPFALSRKPILDRHRNLDPAQTGPQGQAPEKPRHP